MDRASKSVSGFCRVPLEVVPSHLRMRVYDTAIRK